MELKENIKNLLISLKEKGYTRARIEKELELAENSIDQNLARGGTKKLYTSLKLLSERVLHNAMGDIADLHLSDEKELTLRVIYNLTESHRIIAEANRSIAETTKITAESNRKLVDTNVNLTNAFIASPGQGVSSDVSATLVGLQEFLVELASHVHQTSAPEMKAALGKKMVDAKRMIDKTDIPSGVRK